MAYDEIPARMPPLHDIPHYHGDVVRALFVVAAVLLVIGAFMNASSALGSAGIATVAVVLVVAAGITNPAQSWIHWVNAAIACVGTIFFGSVAVGSYRAGGEVTDTTSFVFALALALIFLLSLYFTTRTIRGIMLRTLS